MEVAPAPRFLLPFAPIGLRMLASTRLLRQVVGHCSRSILLGLTILLGLLVLGWAPATVMAQGGNLGGFGTLGGVEPTGQYPPPQYYYALQVYRSGDLVEAIDAFENALRGGRRDIRGRWIDSIPALAMLAECNWHLGNVPAAREYCDQVFQIAIANRGWLGRVDWQSVIQPGVQRATPTGLWPEAMAIVRVPVSDRVMYQSGQPLTESALRRGGVIEETNLRTMDVVEIARGLSLASYRRRILLGPLADQDPLATSLVDSTKYPAGLQIPLARTLIGAVRTTGKFSSHDDKQTVEDASQNSLYSNAAHPLSALTMLSQVSALTGAADVSSVPPMALKTVHVAAALEQPEFIGEAMQLAAGCATPQQADSIRVAAQTVAEALFRDSPMAVLHCLIAGADASVTAGNLDAAAKMLAQARSLGSRRDITLPRLNAYGAYVAARLAAASGASIGIGPPTDLDEAINQMASFALNHRIRSQSLVSMPRVYQLGLIRQSIGTSLGANTSDMLLKAYCVDPPIDVWRRDAVDALASVMVDRTVAHLARVNLAASGGYAEPLLQASDMMLVGRFQQRLALGGRIAQVRALAGLDDNVLDKDVLEFRNKLGREMGELRAASIALRAGDATQADILEAKACSIALSRISLPQTLPPLLNEKLPVAMLPARTGMLTFTSAGNKLFATLSAGGRVTMWTVAGGNRIPGEIGRLLKAIGVGKTRGNRIPEDDSWRESAVNLRRLLVPDDAVLTADEFDELIVVPDGPLWYLPFEILPVQDKNSPLLGDQVSVRYAPTPGFALKEMAAPPVSRAIGLCSDKFFAPRDIDHNESIVQSIVDVIADPVRLPQSMEVPTSLLGDKLGHLIVAAPQNANPSNPLLTSVAPYDQNSPLGTLAAWMRFPVQGPRTVVLFGMRTPVDVGQMGTGDEIFTTLCALHSAGVRSVLVSRWAVGGESSSIALRELVQELPFTGMNASWSRARSVLRRSELNPAGEPLLIKAEHDREGLTGDQPLFWSGYLISSPNQPSEDQAIQDQPAEDQPVAVDPN